jgi:hypothetical protein
MLYSTAGMEKCAKAMLPTPRSVLFSPVDTAPEKSINYKLCAPR